MKTVIGWVAGIGLALLASLASADVYFTEAEVKARLFPNAEFTERAVTIDKPLLKEIKKQTSARLITDGLKVWQVTANGGLQGWLFQAEVLGKHENIVYAMALDAAGNVTGLEVMEYRETHGGEVKEASWKSQLYGRQLGSGFKLGKDIDNISGATLSCRHLADGVHGLLIIHDRLLRNT